MTENQSISKKLKIDNQPGPDLLSDLPLSIVDTILARIPIRDAIRTSLLSRQWRYTWTSLPHIVIEEHCQSRDHELKCRFDERTENFIRNALFQHKGPIHKFKLSASFESSCPDLNEWILHLSMNDIKELILKLETPDFHEALEVNNIYSCEKLTNLELWTCKLDPPPSIFKGFLFLTDLFLHDVYLSPNVIESLVANSLLERFHLINLVTPDSSELRITAPNLKYLYLYDGYTKLCVYAPLLAEMSVLLTNVDFTSEHQQQKSSVCNYTNVIGGLTNLETLRGDFYFTKFLSFGIESCHHTLVCHHLKDIELNDVNFEDKKEILVVACLITSAPNLYKLKISSNLDGREATDSEPPDICFGDFGCEPNFKFEKLRFVCMDGVSGYPSELDFIQFLIESSLVLESMKIVYTCLLGTEEKESLSDELSGCCWASPNATLFVLVG